MEGKDLEVEEDPAEACGEKWMEEQGAEVLEGGDQLKEYPAEVLGEDLSGVLTEVLTREKLGEAQRYDPSLNIIRMKAGRESEPYFWREGLLVREPYQPLGKSLLIISTVARGKVLAMAHNSPVGGHFGRERTLQSIRARMDWPGVVTDVNRVCASCPICQKASPPSMAKAPLHSLPVIR